MALKRALSLLHLLAHARADVPSLPTLTNKHMLMRAALPSTSTTCTTSTTQAPPPLAQPGDLKSYGGETQVAATPTSWFVNPSGETVIVEPHTLITVADASQWFQYSPPPSTVWSTVFTTTTWRDASETPVPFPATLSSLVSQADASTSESLSFLVPLPSVFFSTASAADSTQTTSTVDTSEGGETGYAPPFTPAPTSAATASVYPANLGFTTPNGTSTPVPSALASASSALESCASTEGGIQNNGHIDPGCKSFFDHVTDCFAANGPWDNPYDSARNQNYRACVCMVSDSNPFSEHSALWKNFSGCAACIFTAVDGDDEDDKKGTGLDINAWAAGEIRRLWSFCRAQDPNAYLFTLSLRDWFARLSDYLNATAAPFEPARQSSDSSDGDGGMGLLSAHYTGRPPLANMAWGSSAVSGWAYAGVSPSMETFVTAAEVQGAMITGPASRLVEWVPITTMSGKEWNESVANAGEQKEAEEMLGRGICLGGGRCEKNAAVRGMKTCGLLTVLALVISTAVWI